MIPNRTFAGFMLVLLMLGGQRPDARAQTPADDLARGIELFETGEYQQAQQILVGLDRDALDAEQQEQRDRLVDEVRLAISLSARAEQDADQARREFEAGHSDRAELLWRAVLKNDYASNDLLEEAREELLRVEEKRNLDAALDQGTERTSALAVDAPEDQPASPPATHDTASDRSAQARAFVARGEAAMNDGNYPMARDSFEAALVLMPGLPEATRALADLDQVETGRDQPQSLVDRVHWQKNLLWERTEATYRQLDAEARQAVADEEFEQARLSVLRARQAVESGRANADPISRYEALIGEVEALDRYVSQQEEIWHRRDMQMKRDQVAEQESMRRSQIEESRRIRVESLMDQARQFHRERRLEQAIDALDQILIIDPSFERAQWMKEDLENSLFLEHQVTHKRELYNKQSDAMFEVEKAKMPFFEEISYPKNWPEITAKRTPYNLGKLGSADASAAVRGRLSAVVPDVQMNGVRFADALDQLRDIGGFNMHVRWRALENVGVQQDTPITMNLQDVKLEKALSIALGEAGLPDEPLGYHVDDGVVTVSTQNELDQQTVTRVYDIRDLVVHIPNFDDAPNMELKVPAGDRDSPPAVQGDESLFDDHQSDSLTTTSSNGSVIQKIMNTIRDTVAPGSWRAQNGLVGSIRELNGQIIVTNTLQAQQQLSSLLDQLRETRSIQVSVEARFLTVRTNFLEDIGMDLDIILNNGTAGFDQAMVNDANGIPQLAVDPNTGGTLLIPREFSRLGFLPGLIPGAGQALSNPLIPNQPFGTPGLIPQSGQLSPHSSQFTPIPILNNVLGFSNPQSIQTGVPGSFAGSAFQQPALQVFGSFLDNIQVDFLLRATQADGRSTFLEAPRLTLSNGQRAFVAIVTQQAYVSSLRAVVAQEVGQVEPVISTLNTGSVLDVEATVGADRRYVTMTVRAGRAILEELVNVNVQTTGTSTRGVGAVVQLPRIQVSIARATITVPEGGTVLLGGLRQTGEAELEGGVPILSKIPILKRAYSSRTMVKDESMLLILVKPRIIIQDEVEEDFFPGFARG